MKTLLTAIYCLLTIQLFATEITSSNLPIVVINTNGQEIPDDPKITANMGIIFNGAGQRNAITDAFNHYNGKIGIEIRGESSQMFPMKSYSVELRDDAGKSQDKSILGMPKESDWVLYAPYTDKTLMRNFLAYTFSREMGRWAARCQYVEVVINGDYKGIYVLMERIKRNNGRVAIAKLEDFNNTGDEVTGGYIFSLDKDPNAWYSKYKVPNSTGNAKPQFSYVYPKPENITSSQKAYLESYVDAFELSLASNNFQDPVNGVRKYADLSSFIDYFIINEISRNVDGYRFSTFFHKDRDSKGGKINAGPVWDYDLAFRNADYCDGSKISGWAYEFNSVCPGEGTGMVPFWWERLMSDTAYTSSLRCRWKEVTTTSLSKERINFLVDSVAGLLNEAQARHFDRWKILGQYVWPNPNPIPNSYSEEISILKQWIQNRMAWIADNLPNNGACFDYPLNLTTSMNISIQPNPVATEGRLKIKSRESQEVELSIYTMKGELVIKKKATVPQGESVIPIYTMSWAPGLYIMKLINSKGEIHQQKILKIK